MPHEMRSDKCQNRCTILLFDELDNILVTLKVIFIQQLRDIPGDVSSFSSASRLGCDFLGDVTATTLLLLPSFSLPSPSSAEESKIFAKIFLNPGDVPARSIDRFRRSFLKKTIQNAMIRNHKDIAQVSSTNIGTIISFIK